MANPVDLMAMSEQSSRVAVGESPPVNPQRMVWFWSALTLSTIGERMEPVAGGWIIARLSDSAVLVALMWSLIAVPMLVLMLPAGLAADRWERRRIVIVTEALMALVSLMGAWFIATDRVTVGLIALWFALNGTVLAFNLPAKLALFSDILARNALARAVAIYSAIESGANLAGPMLAGLLLAVAPVAVVFLVNGISYLPLVIGLMLLPRARLSESANRLESGPPWLEGARYAWSHRQLRALLGVAAVSGGLLMPFLGIFMALFVKNELGGAERELGLVMTANGVGALAGALLMMRISAGRRGVFIVASAAVSGALLWAFSICTGAWAAAALVTALALSITLTTGLAATQIQLSVSPEFRGRVTSFCSVATTASMPIGAIALGIASDSLSMRPTIRLCAGCYATLSLTWLLAAKIIDFQPDEASDHRRELSPSILP